MEYKTHKFVSNGEILVYHFVYLFFIYIHVVYIVPAASQCNTQLSLLFNSLTICMCNVLTFIKFSSQ